MGLTTEYLAANRGYAYYELGRVLWHYLHWLTLLVVAAVALLVELAVVHFKGR